MSDWGRRRDDCEPAIVAALRAVGATVETLNGTGQPDLLVGFRGRTYLLECKEEHGRSGKGHRRTKTGLLASQEDWHARWKGAAPVIVTTPEEALAAIGAVVTSAVRVTPTR